ncbi:MAG TPA: DEAD/DEAH box helicase [Candidatus Omnitrophota bacterium]|nr:DEAD/DEAH box helicase [Candidatus Omnitrophota bacterium]
MEQSLSPNNAFRYDAFQQKAIDIINREKSLIVSAPTGAGKTLIAEYAIEQALAKREKAIYTAPIKALSNQKFRDFHQRYGDEIGILTGDVSINPHAPILIMTTEIYRNTLFENPERLKKTAWVIFDEVHYLDDWERGTVWEEAIMFSPLEIQLLCLSATVPNLEEFARWIQTVHKREIEIVSETHRPVPLRNFYQCQGGLFPDPHALKKEGYLGRENWTASGRERRQRLYWRARPNRLEPLIRTLSREEKLPAIYFTFGRRRTETLAWELSDFDFLNPQEKSAVTELTQDLYDRYNLTRERSANEMLSLIERGIAFHHAGMLPTLKEVIERLFTSRLIKLIFTTETFALGINMPARSVIFDELRKFYGTHFANLRTRDFYQMAGRAGRRGMDREGFVYVRVNPHDIPYPEVMRIIYGKHEPVISQFNATYATVLNLFRRFGTNLPDIYPRSFHYYQSTQKGRRRGLDLLKQKLELLKELKYLEGETLTPKGEFASWLYGYELMLSELHATGFLDHLSEADLSMLLAALVYEPRKGTTPIRIKAPIHRLRETCENTLHALHYREEKFRIYPRTKLTHFHLSDALQAWCRGAKFHQLTELLAVDEGEIVRYFRMVIQLLRQLQFAPHSSAGLREKASRAVSLINRDVIDAEKQLRT